MSEGKKYGELNGLIWRLKGLIMPRNNDESVNNADIPEILRFSEISQNGIADYIFHNPGSKILIEAQEYICKKYSWTRKQLMSSIIKLDTRLPEVKSEDWDVATKIVSFRLKDAIHYFEERREIVGAPLSTSEIIAYFLYQNKGDLKQSMWDSTLLLKVLARNDIDTLVSSNTFDKAEQLGYLFKDEFSPQISHNWLTEKFKQGLIPKESQLYLAGDGDNQSGKNFMPINKAGTYYHVMNLFTWAATCMDPWVVKSILAAYYNGQKIGGFDVRNEHGADKVLADTKAAQASDNIQRVVNWRV